MKASHILATFALATAAAGVSAAEIDRFVGHAPSNLLKKEAGFAKVYRAAIHDLDLPEWTKKLSIGFPAEVVEIGGRKLLLTSACSPQGGCSDERMYLLYAPEKKELTGFFFLSPNADAPGDHRMAMSRWIGRTPPKEYSDYLLQRALQDALNPEKDVTRLPLAEPGK